MDIVILWKIGILRSQDMEHSDKGCHLPSDTCLLGDLWSRWH